MGAHVSAIPNHQTGRAASLAFRAITAFFGNLGFELDPSKLDESGRQAVARYTAFYKSRRALFQFGRFTRLTGPGVSGGDPYAAWMVSTPDEAAVGFYKLLARPNQGPCRLRLRDLDAAAVYEVSFWEEGGFIERDKALNCGFRGGDELMAAGLCLDSDPAQTPWKGDFFPELILLKRLR
jgi:alpha-galactosidase